MEAQYPVPENLARAAVLGLACAIADAIDDLARTGLTVHRVTLIGGGSRSTSLRQAVADLTGRQVGWPEPREYAALGAARQAAWALTGEAPHWPHPRRTILDPSEAVDWTDGVRERQRRTGTALYGSELVQSAWRLEIVPPRPGGSRARVVCFPAAKLSILAPMDALLVHCRQELPAWLSV